MECVKASGNIRGKDKCIALIPTAALYVKICRAWSKVKVTARWISAWTRLNERLGLGTDDESVGYQKENSRHDFSKWYEA